MNIFKSKIFIAILAVILVIIISVSVNFVKNGSEIVFEVVGGDFIKITEVSGKVVPGQEIDLSFGVGGKISTTYVDIGDKVEKGDVLARLDISEINAEVDEALADLRSEKARLTEISGNSVSQSQLDSIKGSLVSTLKKTYVTADDIIRNTVDVFINNPSSAIPNFSVSLSDYALRTKIEEQRKKLRYILENWKAKSDSLTIANITMVDVDEFMNNLTKVEDILVSISSGVDDFDAAADKTRSQIDAYISSISSARTVAASLNVEINDATEAVRDVEAEIPILQSSINSAEATINKLSAKKDNYVIEAPFDGVITDENAEMGRIVSSSDMIFSMISNQALEVESFVPEINIAGINIEDEANIIFDAFGEDAIFKAIVSHIDPRETIKDGVTTYRILLDFLKTNDEILSGMNVEIEVEKEKKENVIVIPRYLVNSQNTIKVKRNEGIQNVTVDLGPSDGRGNVLVKSGLIAGDLIIVSE